MSEPKPWLRCRFEANEEDWRPVKWPPPGPCWCTGYSEDHATVVAYVRSEDQITEYWPEAANVYSTAAGEIFFSSRFLKPIWWDELAKGDGG